MALAVLLTGILAAHLALFPRVADLDGFYHLGHAALFAEGSPFDTALPWATQSVIADRGADIWWGFHVLLMPFTAIGDVAWGVRLTALVLTLVLAGSFHWVLRRHAVPGATWWTLALFLAVPNVLFRLVMLRPHMLSVAVGVALLSLLHRGRWFQALLASAAVTWLHLGLFWMPIGLAAAYALVRAGERALGLDRAAESIPALTALAAVSAGSVLGWLARPHPVAAAELAGVQVIRLFAEKATEEPLLFAAELFPLPPLELARTSWLFLLAWTLCVGVVVVRAARGRLEALRAEERTLLLTSVLVSATFLALALLSARRAMVEWVAFGTLALSLTFAVVAPSLSSRPVRGLAGILIAAHLAWGAWRHTLNVEVVAAPPDTMAGVASFLTRSAAPGDIVFHAKWDNFGPLFAQNRSALYLGGMDPIFQFAHDPRLYWEYFYLSADVNDEWTCDAFPCASGVATDTHVVLREHFGARWVVVEPFRNPRLSLYLLRDPRYRLAHETQREAVFEVLPPEDPS